MAVVRVKNLGKVALRGAFDGTAYVIEPGESAILDEECAIKDFGDWGQRNYGTEESTQYRKAEYLRLRGLYGVMPGTRIPSGKFNADGYPLEVPSEVLLAERMPKVEITTMDGRKIPTVIDDPEGNELPLEGGDSTDQNRAIEAMQDQIASLKDALESMRSQVPELDIPKDSPQGQRPKARKAEVLGSQVAGE
jgi:hypothetical protein